MSERSEAVLPRRLAPFALAAVITISGCSLFQSEEIDVTAAQEQFCADMEDYLDALGEYGGLFEDVSTTVGDVKNAASELAPIRDQAIESGQVFQEAVEADTTPGVTIDLVEPETIAAVEDAEEAFADASDISNNTTVVEAGVAFSSAAYGLEVAWVRLFADAGCIEDEAEASQWVSDYVTALQTDLAAAGLYTGVIDGIYGPKTIESIERLQRDAGLPETGLMDPPTQLALQAALGNRASAEVGALQGILISTGYYSGTVDGVWSPEVEEALKALQTDLGVPATGVVDAATLRAFEDALAEAGVPPVTTTAPATPEPTPPAVTTTLPSPTTTTPDSTTTVPPTVGGVLDVLEENEQFGQFLAAVETAGLTELLSGPGPFTVFAPDDEAFTAAGELPTDPAALADLLLRHVVEGELTGFDLQGMTSVTTAQGSDLVITIEQGSIILDGVARVVISNVAADNGLAHVVNAVLIPAT